MNELIDNIFEILAQELVFPLFYGFAPENAVPPFVVFTIDQVDTAESQTDRGTSHLNVDASIVSIALLVDDLQEVSNSVHKLTSLTGKMFDFGIVDYIKIQNCQYKYDVIEGTDQGFHSMFTDVQIFLIRRN